MKLKEARDKIYQAIVKDIPIGTRVNDGEYEYAFNQYMAKDKSKALNFKLADPDVKNWYVKHDYDAHSILHKDVYHKSWLDFDTEQELHL